MSMSQGPHVKLQQKLKSACREPKSPKSHRDISKQKLGSINPLTSEISICKKSERKFCPSDYISSDSVSDAASSHSSIKNESQLNSKAESKAAFGKFGFSAERHKS